MNSVRRSVSLRLIACAVVVGALAAIPTATAGATSIDQLGSQLSQEQSRQQTLSAAISRLSGEISSLDSQIALVQRREAAVRAELDHDRAVLAKTQIELAKTRKQLAILKPHLDALTLRAPADGWVINPPRPDEVGKTFDHQQPAPF